jgi:hypothetical protein
MITASPLLSTISVTSPSDESNWIFLSSNSSIVTQANYDHVTRLNPKLDPREFEGIDKELFELNIKWAEGCHAIALVNYSKKIKQPDWSSKAVKERQCRKYAHLAGGGWYSQTLDPKKDWQARSSWLQFKPLQPRKDYKEGQLRLDAYGNQRYVKYETPPKEQVRAYFANVPRSIWQNISDNLNVPIEPQDANFWQWVRNHTEIPIVPTEGIKKGLVGLSNGIVAIPFPGVSTGFTKGKDGKRKLHTDLLPFCHPNRRFAIAFDADVPGSNGRKNNQICQKILGALLTEKGCEVSYCHWHQKNGKGLDDLLNNGKTYKETDSCRIDENYFELTDCDQKIDEKYLGNAIDLTTYPDKNCMGIKARQGTGKTVEEARYARELNKLGIPVIYIAPTVALCKQFSKLSGLPYRTENSREKSLFGYTICPDSFYKKENGFGFNINEWGEDRFPVVIMEETEQLTWHRLTGSTDIAKRRTTIHKNYKDLIIKALKHSQVIVSDADLSDYSINQFRDLAKENNIDFKPHIIVNNYKGSPLTVNVFENQDELLVRLKDSFKKRETLFVQTTTQKSNSPYSSKNIERIGNNYYKAEEILRIDSETVANKESRAAYYLHNPEQIKLSGIKLVIISPVGLTGFSFAIFNYFDSNFVFGGKGHLAPNSLVQFMWRLRDTNVPRYISYPEYSITKEGSGSGDRKTLGEAEIRKQNNNLKAMSFPVSDDSEFFSQDCSLFNEWCLYAARFNRHQANYGNVVETLLYNQNAVINYVTKPSNKQDLIMAKAEIKECKEISISEEVEQISSAENLDDETANETKRKSSLTTKEQNELKRHSLKKKFVEVNQHITEAMVRDTGTYQELRNLYLSTWGEAIRKNKQIKALDFLRKQNNDADIGIVETNKILQERKYQIVQSILDKIGFGAHRSDDQDLRQLAHQLVANWEEIKLHLGVNLSKCNPDKPFLVLNHVLKTCGIKYVQSDHKMRNGVKGTYTLTSAIKGMTLSQINEQCELWYIHDLERIAELPIDEPFFVGHEN